jgi:hypothetical protein
MIKSVRSTETVLQAAIDATMTMNGWPPRRICGLPAVYVRDTLVSPYFVCSSFRKLQNGNYYCVEGAIGLIHQSFEGSWTTRHPEFKEKNRLAVLLHIANLPVLNESRLLLAAELDSKVRIFCDAVSALLLAMPRDEHSLKRAFDEDRICGRAVGSFSGYSERPKFHEFVEFVKQLDPDRSSLN